MVDFFLMIYLFLNDFIFKNLIYRILLNNSAALLLAVA